MEWQRTMLRSLLTLSILVASYVGTEDPRGEHPNVDHEHNPWKNISQKTGRRSRRFFSLLPTLASPSFGFCIFPFIFNGTSYFQCTSNGATNFYWCAHSLNYDTDLLWGFCTESGIYGNSDCSPVSSSNRSTSLCLISPTDATWASTYCTVSGTYYNGYIEAFCFAPSSVNSTTLASGTQDNMTSSTTTPSSTTDVSSITSSTTTPSSTTDVSSITSSTTTPSSTTNVSSMTSSSTTARSSTTNISSTTTSSSTTNVSSMISSSTTTRSSTTNVSSMTSSSTTTPSSITNVSSMTSSSTTTTSSSTNISSMASAMTLHTAKTQGSTTSAFSVFTAYVGSDVTSTAGTSLQLSLEQIAQNLSLSSFLTVTSSGFERDDLPLVLYVLGNITSNAQRSDLRLDVDTVKKVLAVSDQLIHSISSDPVFSLEKNLGPQLLMCLENLLSVMNTTDRSFSVSFRQLDLHCSVAPCDVLQDNGLLTVDSGTTVSLPEDDTDYPPRCLVNMLSMTFRPQNRSFSSQYDCPGEPDSSYSLASVIRTNILRFNDRTYHVADINMTFTCENKSCDQNPTCVFWDFHLNKWSSMGCLTQVLNGVTSCLCHHLTSFSILMSGSLPKSLADSPALDYMTKTGLMVSAVSLLICVSIQVILLRRTHHGMAFHRHMAILHMSMFLLISHISFLASSFIDPDAQKKLCVALTFCTHLSLLGFFAWTLVQGTCLVVRLVFVFHHVTMTEFTVLSVVLGYLCPLAIAVGTFAAYYPHHYRRDDGCWLNNSSGASMAFTVPTIVIMSLNVLVLVMVIRKLLRPSISEVKNEDEEVVKKVAKAVLFCTPQFGLTWAIGIPLLTNYDGEWLHYLFDLLNPLQGVFILLFGCLLDNKVKLLLKKYFLKKSSNSSLVTVVASSG